MKHRASACLAVAAAALLSASPTAHAESTEQPLGIEDEALFRCLKPKGAIRISFRPELELAELVTWASGFSCKSIVFSSRVASRKLKVNIIAPRKMGGGSAWALFHTALRAMNLAVVPKGAVYEVVEAPEGKTHALPLLRGKQKGARGLVRSLVTAEHLDASELGGVLEALVSKSGEVIALPGSRMVLVTDFADHITRMAELLAEVDRSHAESEGIYMVKVHHAEVAELAATLEAILGAGSKTSTGAASGPRPRTRKPTPKRRPASSATATTGPRSIIAEPRTGHIVLVASPPAFARARALIKRLDIRVEEQSSHIHMIGLEHADAEALATTLTTLLSGVAADAGSKTGGRKPTPAGPRGAISVEGDVRVTHDGPTNALLIMATMRDFLSLREIVTRLDSTRPQVYIEASIMEVSVSGDRNIDGSFHVGGDESGTTWLAGLQQSDLRSTDLSSLVGAAGLLGGVFGQPLTGLESFIGQTIPSFGVLFQALATSRRANLISSPRIMTSDNTEATIKVSETRREPGATTTVATGGTTQAVESVDAALTLKVTPHVNATDEVRLEIDLTVEEFLPSRSAGFGSDKSVRQITNTVVVRDQESVIIGGLMVEREIKTESKVPLLGDVPLLGYLFKSTSADKEKRNLVVLLTPYVLGTRNDHQHIVRQTLSERAEFMRAHLQLSRETTRTKVDYRKKHGLLEAINQRAAAIERERTERANAAPALHSNDTFEGPY